MIVRAVRGSVFLLWLASASAAPLVQTPAVVCAGQSGNAETEVIAFFEEGKSCSIECQWHGDELKVLDPHACSPDLLFRSRSLGAVVVDGAAWAANQTSLVVHRKRIIWRDLPVKVWIPGAEGAAAKREVSDELANADYLLAKNRTGVRLDEQIEVVANEQDARKLIGYNCGQNKDVHKRWADDDRLNVYYAWGDEDARCDPSGLGFRAVYVKRGGRLGTILHEILHDAGLSNHIEAVGYCEWDPTRCGYNLLGDDLRGYLRNGLSPAQIFWMHREADSILVWLNNKDASATSVAGRSCANARDRLPYLGPWVSKFCDIGDGLEGIRPTKALILSWLRCDSLTVSRALLERTLSQRGAEDFRIGVFAAVEEMAAIGSQKKEIAVRYLEITESAREFGTIRPVSDVAEFRYRYGRCDWSKRLKDLINAFPFLLDDADARSVLGAGYR